MCEEDDDWPACFPLDDDLSDSGCFPTWTISTGLGMPLLDCTAETISTTAAEDDSGNTVDGDLCENVGQEVFET
jgi:hypothetical protein